MEVGPAYLRMKYIFNPRFGVIPGRWTLVADAMDRIAFAQIIYSVERQRFRCNIQIIKE